LRFLDPESHVEIRRIEVRDRGMPVKNLNELEYVKGEIFANVWKVDMIARISPETGKVLGWIDLSALRSALGPARNAEVLNGIAHDAARDRIFVTGKLWPKLFEIKLVPR
jgi:glutaminyl-peptide cyclotransferase